MQSSPLREKRKFDWYSDGYGAIITQNENTVEIKRPKDASDRCKFGCKANNAKDCTLRTHRIGK